MVLLLLFASVMKADGEVKKSELNVVKRFLVQTFGEQGALEALQLLKEFLKQNYNVSEIAQQASLYFNYSQRTELVHLLSRRGVRIKDVVILAIDEGNRMTLQIKNRPIPFENVEVAR